MQKDAVLRGTPIPLFYKAATGITVEALVQHPDYPEETASVILVELPTAAEHIKVYVATYTPNQTGWYHVTFRAYAGDVTVSTDANRFYSYTEAEQSTGAVGEPVLQEITVKVGEVASIAYRGITGLSVQGQVVFEEDLLSPNTGLVLAFDEKPTPTGFKPMYLASFAPTRAGKHYVYVKTTPAGGEALVVVNAFKTLPYSRAAGTIKSSATSTVT